jgi:hypothetical protein
MDKIVKHNFFREMIETRESDSLDHHFEIVDNLLSDELVSKN